jgi:hypothetical protein
MIAQPLAKLGVNPVNDFHANRVLIKQRRRQPQQRLVMKDTVS